MNVFLQDLGLRELWFVDLQRLGKLSGPLFNAPLPQKDNCQVVVGNSSLSLMRSSCD